jgi:cytochrome c oxidase subunit 3
MDIAGTGAIQQSDEPVAHRQGPPAGHAPTHQASSATDSLPRAAGWRGIVADVSSDQRLFKDVPWGKPMMWIFLLSDTFIFGSFLISYMTVRTSTTVPWPNPSEVFALDLFGQSVPLLLIAIMTFILISSSGTMALAVNFGYRRDRRTTFWLLCATAALGATFVGMQAFEWTKLILEGVRPWGNPWGAVQFGSSFFMITGFHGTHVTIGVIFLLIVATKVRRGDLDRQRPGFLTGRRGNYEIVEILGLYWHFVDLVWVFIFAFFYLW